MNQDPYFLRKEVSNSDLGALEELLNPKDKSDPTQAYWFGTIVDALITETDRVNFFKRTVDGEAVDKKTWESTFRMRDAFWKDPLCASLMENASPQKVMARDMEMNFKGYPFTLPARCKWDIWRDDLGYGGDIKSTAAETQTQFEAAIKFFSYPRQRAWYMDIAGSDYDVLIGISKKNFKIFKKFIKRGSAFYLEGLEHYTTLAFKYYLINQAA